MSAVAILVCMHAIAILYVDLETILHYYTDPSIVVQRCLLTESSRAICIYISVVLVLLLIAEDTPYLPQKIIQKAT